MQNSHTSEGDNQDYVDRDLFQGTAYYYARFREPYTPRLPSVLQAEFQLDGSGTLLDLGTGTGQIALALSSLFSHTLAADPDPGMLEEARHVAKKRGIQNVEFKHARAEDLQRSLGPFRLVTIGAAFHWMERERILDFCYDTLVEGGALAIINSWNEPTHLPPPEVPPRIPNEDIHAVIKSYLGPKRRAGSGTFRPPERRYEDMLIDSKFGYYGILRIPGEYRTRTTEEVLGFLYSTSYAAKRLFGARVGAFEEEVRSILEAESPEGVFTVFAGGVEVIYARRIKE